MLRPSHEMRKTRRPGRRPSGAAALRHPVADCILPVIENLEAGGCLRDFNTIRTIPYSCTFCACRRGRPPGRPTTLAPGLNFTQNTAPRRVPAPLLNLHPAPRAGNHRLRHNYGLDGTLVNALGVTFNSSSRSTSEALTHSQGPSSPPTRQRGRACRVCSGRTRTITSSPSCEHAHRPRGAGSPTTGTSTNQIHTVARSGHARRAATASSIELCD